MTAVPSGCRQHPQVVGVDQQVHRGGLRQRPVVAGIGYVSDLCDDHAVAYLTWKKIAHTRQLGHEGGGRRVVDAVPGYPVAPGARRSSPRCGSAIAKASLPVVGDEHRRDGVRPENVRDLLAQPPAHPRVQVAERLVQQHRNGARGNRPRQRHPLLLAPGELVGVALLQPAKPGQRQNLGQPRRPRSCRDIRRNPKETFWDTVRWGNSAYS